MRKKLFIFSLVSISLSSAFIPVSDVQAITTEAQCLAAGGICQVTAVCDDDRHVAQPVETEGCNDNFFKTLCCLPGAVVAPTGLTDAACASKYTGGVCRIETPSALCNGGELPTVDLCTEDNASTRRCCVPPGGSTSPITTSNNNTSLGTYQLLEEVPGQSGIAGDLPTYLQKLYRFTFWAIGVAALFMLTVGGFMYVTSAGNTSRISTAKTIITDSLLGIVVALFAWLFLYVINPDLTEGLQLPSTASTKVTNGGGATSSSNSISPASAKEAAKAILMGGTGINLSSAGDCTNASGTAISPQYTLDQVANGQSVIRCMNGCPGKGACTQTTALNSQMLITMVEIAKTYPFTVTSITGGSHCEDGISGCKGLSNHYAGNAVDISTGNKGDWPAIIKAFRNAGSDGGQTFCDNDGERLSADRCSEANHIHVAF